MSKLCITSIVSLFMLLLAMSPAEAKVDFSHLSPRAKEAVLEGANHVAKSKPKKEAAGLAAYALLKSGHEKKSPAVLSFISVINKKCGGGKYQPTGGEKVIYEACVDLMALEAHDRVVHTENIKLILDYIVSRQDDLGGWHYTKNHGPNGDTSVTQNVVLALWAAQRMKIKVPNEVLIKLANWHVNVQQAAGGFAYQPPANSATKVNPTVTMTAAGCASMGVLRLMMYGPKVEKKSQGKIKTTINKKSKKSAQDDGTFDAKLRDKLDAGVARSLKWLNQSAGTQQKKIKIADWTFAYYLYTVERIGSVQKVDKVGGGNWYQRGTDALLRDQQKNGSWRYMTIERDPADTCFALLFLMRATEKFIPKPRKVAGGMFKGGRGFPDDFSTIAFDEDGIAKKEKEDLGEMGDLLASLENGVSGIELIKIQKKIVKKIRLGNPEALIGDRKRLLKLAKYPIAETRQIALWALARCAKLEDAKMLVELLKDENLGVAVEARNALCWLSRKPAGLGEKKEPFEGIEDVEGLGDEEKRKLVIAWREDVTKRWTKWYLQNRPYDLRDDLEEPVKDEKSRARR